MQGTARAPARASRQLVRVEARASKTKTKQAYVCLVRAALRGAWGVGAAVLVSMGAAASWGEPAAATAAASRPLLPALPAAAGLRLGLLRQGL